VDCAVALVGGQIIDPDANEIFAADVAIDDGRVVGIARERGRFNAARVVDVSGLFVCPGIVDSHVHVYQHVSPGSLDPDQIGIRQGVCAVVDAGSFGPRNAAGFYEYVVQRAITPTYGLVNISRLGNSINPGEGEVLGYLNPSEVVRLIERSGDWLCGVKARASVTAAGLLGVMSTALAKQAAAEAGRPLMVHIGNAPPTLDEVCALLTSGDLITHCFHGKLGGSVTRQGQMRPSVVAAVERGVLLDIGHGSASFAWATGEQALALGYPPHIISTDLHRGCINGPTYSMVKTMSKFLHLGMDLIAVIRASSPAPARALGLGARFGRIAEGFPANLSVIDVVERREQMFDVEKQSRPVERVIEARYALIDGEVYEADPDATAPKT
jgi:dihydroorotase